jgi:TolB protein
MLRLVRVIGMLFGLILLLLVGMMGYLRREPSEAEWIAFASDGKIYRMNADGANLKQLTDGNISFGYRDFDPFWSPDGQWIGFLSRRRESNRAGFYRVPRNGGEVEALGIVPEFSDIIHADLSPDGQWLVWAGYQSITMYQIYRMRIDGNPIEQVTTTEEDATKPRFSVDGQSILFAFGYPHSEHYLYQMQLDGSEPQLLQTPPINPHAPSLSPDRKWIVFSASPDSYLENEIMRMRVDGSELQQITQIDGYHYEPSWSPNGEWIVFTSVRGMSQTIHKIRPDGTDERQLTTFGGDNPRWSPIIDMAWDSWTLGTIGIGLQVGVRGLSLWGGKREHRC